MDCNSAVNHPQQRARTLVFRWSIVALGLLSFPAVVLLLRGERRLVSTHDKIVSFGNLYVGETSSKEIILRNTHAVEVRLLAATPTCRCLGIALSEKVIKPGRTAILSMTAQGAQPLGKSQVRVRITFQLGHEAAIDGEDIVAEHTSVAALAFESEVFDFGELKSSQPESTETLFAIDTGVATQCNGLRISSPSKAVTLSSRPDGNHPHRYLLEAHLSPESLPPGNFAIPVQVCPTESGRELGELDQLLIRGKIVGQYTADPPVLYLRPPPNRTTAVFHLNIVSSSGPVHRVEIAKCGLLSTSQPTTIRYKGNVARIDGAICMQREAGLLTGKLTVKVNDLETVQVPMLGYVSGEAPMEESRSVQASSFVPAGTRK